METKSHEEVTAFSTLWAKARAHREQRKDAQGHPKYAAVALLPFPRRHLRQDPGPWSLHQFSEMPLPPRLFPINSIVQKCSL